MINCKKDLKISTFSATRAVFQNQSSNAEPAIVGESANLRQVSETVKESYSARLELKRGIDESLSNIKEEQAQFKQIVSELLQRVKSEHPAQPINSTFNCLGKDIQVIMYPNGSYEEYLDSKPINFLTWAIQQKQITQP